MSSLPKGGKDTAVEAFAEDNISESLAAYGAGTFSEIKEQRAADYLVG
ncbi:hypothetical protein ABE057_15300 [Bacillus paralicheniformis]|nr:hypothetical protein [Bacillus sp. B19-2]MCJ2145716.1 hypothetical protein [Bacillus sp. B19-2]